MKKKSKGQYSEESVSCAISERPNTAISIQRSDHSTGSAWFAQNRHCDNVGDNNDTQCVALHSGGAVVRWSWRHAMRPTQA